jgi:hypothetical protein
VTNNRQVREMDNRIRELECQLGRKTLELKILKEALERSRPKKRPCSCTRRCRRLSGQPGRQHAGLGRSTMYDRLTGSIRTRGSHTKAGDADLLHCIRQIAAQRPTYGYRRIAAVLNQQLRADGLPANHKRVYRIMAASHCSSFVKQDPRYSTGMTDGAGDIDAGIVQPTSASRLRKGAASAIRKSVRWLRRTTCLIDVRPSQ